MDLAIAMAIVFAASRRPSSPSTPSLPFCPSLSRTHALSSLPSLSFFVESYSHRESNTSKALHETRLSLRTIIMSKRDKLTASFAQVDESKEGFVPIEKVGEGWRAAYRPQRHIRPVRPLTTTPLFPNHPRRSGAR